MSIALLTCTPPNFGDDPPPTPTDGPLILFPLAPELVAGSAFTFVADGGTPPYTFSVNGDGTIDPSSGKYTAPAIPSLDTVIVTDDEDEVAETSVVVHPSQLWVLPAGATIPAETGITFSGHGGTPPYTYVKVSGEGDIDADGVYSSPAETEAVIRVTDNAGVQITTHVFVLPPANPLTINPASALIETNVELVFSAGGGTGPYTFAKVSGVGGMVSATTYRSAAAGSAIVRVTDSAFHTADASITVNAPPPPLVVTPNGATVLLDGSQVFTASGGAPPYSFAVRGGGAGGTLTGSGSSRTYHAPHLIGSGSDAIMVTDNLSRTTTAVALLMEPPADLAITPPGPSILHDGSVSLIASGGTAPFGWAIIGGGGGSLSSSSGTSVTYVAPGVEDVVTVRLTDSESNHIDAIITVNPDPLSLSPASLIIQTGNLVTFTGAGGTSPYSYTKVSGVGGIDPSSGLYTSPVEGTAIVRVTDARARTQDASIIVDPPPLTLSPTSVTIQAGSSVSFTGAGGTPPYAYSKDWGVGGIHSSSGLYTSSTPGTAMVRVTDSRTPTGRTATASVTVAPPPAPPLELSPVSVNVETGSDQTFAASGGATPYAWDVVQGAPGGTITPSGVYTAPGTPGVYTARVTDSSSPVHEVRTATVNVYAPLVIEPHPTSVDAGAQLDFNASGGIPPLVFSVPPGARGTIVAGTGLYTAPGTAGADTVRVTDLQGKFTDWSFTVLDPAVWNTRQSIDASGRSGQYASLALDPAGVPQIVYWESQDDLLKLARWNGSTWTLSTIDDNHRGDEYASLALDPVTGRARVAWYDTDGNELAYRAWNGSGWDAEQIVDTSGDVGEYASIALDASGNPGIAYYDSTSSALKYAAWTGSSWDTETVDNAGSVGQYASLALDTSGNPRIAYYDATNSALKYAAWNGTWNIVTVDSGGTGTVGQYASLKLDGEDHPRIGYYDTTNTALKYAEWNGTSWDVTTVDSTGAVGQYASLALDPDDFHPHIAYYDSSTGNGNLKYAARTGSIWLVGTVDAGPGSNDVGTYASLAVDPVTRLDEDRLLRRDREGLVVHHGTVTDTKGGPAAALSFSPVTAPAPSDGRAPAAGRFSGSPPRSVPRGRRGRSRISSPAGSRPRRSRPRARPRRPRRASARRRARCTDRGSR